jgi:CRISPR-associated protein Csb1
MAVDLALLADAKRLLFAIPLKPLLGSRFQPTGFPNLGAATFQSAEGACLLVESAQSMANRLELTIWDEVSQDLKADLNGLSHVRVLRTEKGQAEVRFLTDTVLESHRLNSPYLLEESSKKFFNELKNALGGLETGPIDRKKFAEILLKYDVGSLLHGVFLAKKDLAGGRLRVARALSAFIEANGVRVAASGGVKNDHVNPSGVTKDGFGNVPFARDEFTADSIDLNVILDLAQIRGYGLGEDVNRLLILLALYKLRALLDGGMRLRTACDLTVATTDVIAARAPVDFVLPTLTELTAALRPAIGACISLMTVTQADFNDEFKKGKSEADSKTDDSDDDEIAPGV